jgi:hypothetical protein
VGEAGDLVSLRAKRKEEKKNGPGKWAAREEKTLFKFIFKLSNFNQTRNHAFES